MRQANRRATSASPVIQNPSPITLTPRHPRRAGRPRPGYRGVAGSCAPRRSRRWRARGAETRKQRLTACHNAGLAFVETGTRGTQHVSGSSRSLPPQGRLRKPQVVVHLAAPPGTAGDNGHLPVEAEQLTQHFMRHCRAPFVRSKWTLADNLEHTGVLRGSLGRGLHRETVTVQGPSEVAVDAQHPHRRDLLRIERP
jgi:hypothetical protein